MWFWNVINIVKHGWKSLREKIISIIISIIIYFYRYVTRRVSSRPGNPARCRSTITSAQDVPLFRYSALHTGQWLSYIGFFKPLWTAYGQFGRVRDLASGQVICVSLIYALSRLLASSQARHALSPVWYLSKKWQLYFSFLLRVLQYDFETFNHFM